MAAVGTDRKPTSVDLEPGTSSSLRLPAPDVDTLFEVRICVLQLKGLPKFMCSYFKIE